MTALAVAGRSAVITGAGSGIGRALAVEAAARGMAVAIGDIDAAGLAETGRRLDGARVLSLPVDVTDPLHLAGFADAVAAQLPPAALVFANAGILRMGSLLAMSPDTLRQLLDVNVIGTVQTVQAFAPALVAAGTPAQIVLTASTGAMISHAELAGYCATKHALWPIAEAFRDDLAAGAGDVGVSLLMPGAVTTAIFEASAPDRAAAADAITPAAAARIAFDGAIARRFLIPTHPGFVDRVAARFGEAVATLR